MTEKQKAPRNLSREARQLHAELAQEYAIHDAAGRRLLLTACECLDRMRRAQKLIKRHGELLTARDGLKANPAVAIERDARAQMLACLKQLNLDVEPLQNVGRPTKHQQETRKHAYQ